MKGPVQIPQTPITEETFKKQGWTKEFEDDEKGDEYYYTINLPKNNKNPYGLQLISTSNTETLEGINQMEGQYFVQLLDCGGLGQCFTEEEVEVLYKTLCRKSIYQNWQLVILNTKITDILSVKMDWYKFGTNNSK